MKCEILIQLVFFNGIFQKFEAKLKHFENLDLPKPFMIDPGRLAF